MLKILSEKDWREEPNADQLRPLLSLRAARKVLKAFVEERWEDWQVGAMAAIAALRK